MNRIEKALVRTGEITGGLIFALGAVGVGIHTYATHNDAKAVASVNAMEAVHPSVRHDDKVVNAKNTVVEDQNASINDLYVAVGGLGIVLVSTKYELAYRRTQLATETEQQATTHQLPVPIPQPPDAA